MVTWWIWPTSFTLLFYVSRFILLLSHSWILSSSQQSPIHHSGRHYLLYFYPILLLPILVNPWLTSNGSWSQDLLISVCPTHNYSECVTVIFSLFKCDVFIRDSCFLEIPPSSIHKLLESPLRESFHMPREIRFQGVICRDISWIFFTPDVLDINILFFHHVLQK